MLAISRYLDASFILLFFHERKVLPIDLLFFKKFHRKVEKPPLVATYMFTITPSKLDFLRNKSSLAQLEVCWSPFMYFEVTDVDIYENIWSTPPIIFRDICKIVLQKRMEFISSLKSIIFSLLYWSKILRNFI